MTASTFKEALTLVLAHEGGYVNHPRDPGGATNKGVTQAVYDAYRTGKGLGTQSVRHITLGEASAIYKRRYWDLVRGDELPTGVDYAVFDFAVNSGTGRAKRYLQKVLGVEADGELGPQSMRALAAVNDREGLVTRLCGARMAFLRSLGTFSTFGRGWTRRVMGANDGFQASDTGVIDHAINMMRDHALDLPLPTFIGGKVGEPQTAKAIGGGPALPMPQVMPLSYEAAKAQRWGV